MKAKIRIEKPFRIEVANNLYKEMSMNNDCYEFGVDTYGFIYFAMLNGNIERYSRLEFIKIAKNLNN